MTEFNPYDPAQNPNHVGNIPAGYKRDEALAQNADNLAQQAEQTGIEAGGSPDADVFRADRNREIRNAIMQGGLEITNANDAYMYSWVCTALDGIQITRKKALGWAVVQGEDQECLEHRYVDGTRRVGDVLLMKLRKDIYLRNEQYFADVRRAQEFGVTSELHELGDKHADKGLRIIDNEAEFAQITGQQLGGVMTSQTARQAAGNAVGQMVRDGMIPGMEIARK